MFCCGSKKKKSKKSTKPEEPSTSSDQQSYKKEEESQKVNVPPPAQKPTDDVLIKLNSNSEMLRQIQNINDLKNKGCFEKSVKCEHDYITELINKENVPQAYALNYEWALNYTKYLRGAKLQIQQINNKHLQGANSYLRKDAKPDKDFVLLNEQAWTFVYSMYGGGPEIRVEPQKKPELSRENTITLPPKPQTSIISQTSQNFRPPQKQPTVQTVSAINTPKSVDRFNSTISVSQQSQNLLIDKSKDEKKTREFQPRNESVQNQRSTYIQPMINTIVSPQQKTFPIVGLRNPRYYCYLNSALQLLLSIDNLNEGILTISPKSGYKYLQAYQELLKNIKKSNQYQQIAPQSIWELCSGKFQYNKQQDSHEFLLFFLSKIQEELVGKYKNKTEFKSANEAWIDYTSKNQDIVDIIFAGQSVSQSFCKACNSISEGYDPIWDLSLPICKSYSTVDLMDCLKQHFKEEIINDTWKCDKCKKTNKSVKRRMFISQTPQYLIIQFKRFTTFPVSQKINEPIQYPEKLDLSEFCDDGLKTKYKLKAFITHMGQINGGHYKAYAERYDSWYQFDDENVTKCSGKSLIDRQAYVLLYEKY